MTCKISHSLILKTKRMNKLKTQKYNWEKDISSSSLNISVNTIKCISPQII